MIKSVKKHRTVNIFGKRTSVRMETQIWDALKIIAKREHCTINELVSLIYRQKTEESSLSSALRVFAVNYFLESSTDQGHKSAGHGTYFHSIGKDIYLRKRQESIDFNLHSEEEKY
jgi:predicted DNA-binding ribbon-helix-helix protein